MSVSLHFHGAAGTVTGSSYRVVHPKGQFLIDCGLFQGNKTVRSLNYNPLPYNPADLDFVLLTHAHIDHAGLLPRLYANGYDGPIHSTVPTTGLMEFLLEDGAAIQESEAASETKKRARRGEPPLLPLYTAKDATAALDQRKGHPFEQWITPGDGVRMRFWNAGHILGSASIEVEVDDGAGQKIRILFSGDIGPDEKVFYTHPDAPSGFDYILCESTYGGRDRVDYTLEQRRAALKKEINDAMAHGGNLVVPTFAVERSQELLHDIGALIKNGEADPKRVFLDSPLARKVTSVYKEHADIFKDVELEADELFDNEKFHIVESVEESKAIARISSGAMILSASGMCDAGRIKHHLRNNLISSKNTVLFVGYQAPGSLGSVIQRGAKQARIHGNLVPIRANIRTISNYSAHADHGELIDWLTERLPAHGAIFLTHGEDKGRNAMRDALVEKGLNGKQILSPMLDDAFELRATGVAGVTPAKEQRIDPEQFANDWHNEFSDFTAGLSEKLQGAKNDKDRLAMMKKLQDALSGV